MKKLLFNLLLLGNYNAYIFTADLPPTSPKQALLPQILMHTIFTCTHPECNHTSIDPQNLTKHMNTHPKEKLYMCTYPECNHASTKLSDLTMHMRTHTSKKPTTRIFRTKHS